MDKDVSAFVQRMEAMYERLGSLYTQTELSVPSDSSLLPAALKELSLAAEELQVATEELHQQSEQITSHLDLASHEVHYYQTLFDCAAPAQLLTTSEGKILAANQTAAQLLNVSQSSLINRLLISFVPLNLRSAFRSQINRLLQPAARSQVWTTYLQSQSGEILSLVASTAIAPSGETYQTNLHWTFQETVQLQTVLTKFAKENETSDEASDVLSDLYDRPLNCYDKGDIIPLKPHFIWIVKQGLVKLSTLTLNNEEIVLSLVGSSLPFSVGSSALHTYQATAMTDVQMFNLSLAEIKAQPKLAQNLLPKFHQRLQQTEILLNIVGQRRTSKRLYYLLQMLKQEIGQAVQGGTRLSLRLTHEELANLCCTTRVTMTRMLGTLQQQQKIQFDSKSCIILNEGYW